MHRSLWAIAASIPLREPEIDINLDLPCYGAALHEACRKYSTVMVKLLVEHGADVNSAVIGVSGTLFQFARLFTGMMMTMRGLGRIQYLIDQGADIKQAGGLYGSVLGAAAIPNMPEMVTSLLTKGAQIDVPDPWGCMHIHFAAFHSIDSLAAILEARGDTSVCDKMGRGPLHWAAQNGRAQAVKYLLSAMNSAAINEKNIDGGTPLCWAAQETNATDSS